MAMADYYLCDGCGKKAIYDADWYDRVEGNALAILCKECSKTLTVKVVPRAAPRGEEGWVLVPREPDRKMVKRGRAEIGGGSTFSQEEREEMAAEIYCAMLAAAPKAPGHD